MILRLSFDKAGTVKGSSLLPIHGYRLIFNMMSDLTTDSRTRAGDPRTPHPATRVVEAHVSGEIERPCRDLERRVERQDDVSDPIHQAHQRHPVDSPT